MLQGSGVAQLQPQSAVLDGQSWVQSQEKESQLLLPVLLVLLLLVLLVLLLLLLLEFCVLAHVLRCLAC